MLILYGIPNCDTVKKAMKWLTAHQISYQFHDYKQAGITSARLKAWCGQVGWETLLNKKSTTWRELDPLVQAATTTEAKAIKLMAVHTSSIKRPVIERDGQVLLVGFQEKDYAAALL